MAYNSRLLSHLSTLIQAKFPCEGNGATHSGLGLSSSINNQDMSPTDMPTDQPELISLSLRHFSHLIPDGVKLAFKTNCPRNGIKFWVLDNFKYYLWVKL